MKKLIVIFLLLPLVGMAQFNKGQVFLGGSMSVQNQYLSDHSGPIVNTFGITPRVGYFINEKWALGGTAGYSSTDQTNTNADINGRTVFKYNSISISAGFFGRRYFTISEKFLFALEGNLSFSRSNSTSTYASTDAAGVLTSSSYSTLPSYGLGVGFRPLFIFFPSPKWGIEAGLGNLSVSRQRNLSDHTGVNTFNLSALGTLSFGVTYYFTRV